MTTLSENTNGLEKSYEQILDFSSNEMPPLWALNNNTNEYPVESGIVIHTAGKSRVISTQIEVLLREAKEVVAVSSFLLADKIIEDAIFVTAKRGVRVYVLLASEQKLEQDPLEDFTKKVVNYHKEILKRLGGLVFFRSAHHFHAKFVITDPETNPRGILLTGNLTKEALERNEELAVELSPEEAKHASEIFRWTMWEEAEHELIDNDRFKSVKPLGKLTHPANTLSICTTTLKKAIIREKVIELINRAQSHIVVSSFGWQDDHEVIDMLTDAALSGIKVTILARMRTKAMSALIKLAKAGAEVFGFKWLHAKALWTDQGEGIVMSANFESSGLDTGFEMGVLLSEEKALELRERLIAWQHCAPWHLIINSRLGELNGDVQVWEKGKLTEYHIIERKEVDLGKRSAKSASELTVSISSDENKIQSEYSGSYVKEVAVKWIVEAPKLQNGAKELFQHSKKEAEKKPYSPRVFQEGKRRVVAIQHVEELEAAKILSFAVKAEAIVTL